MTSLRDQMLQDVIDIFLSSDEDVSPDVVSITYDPDDTAKVISAMIDPAFDMSQGTYTDEQGVMIIRADATTGIASPAAGDFFFWTAIGKRCRVTSVTSDKIGIHELTFAVGEAT